MTRQRSMLAGSLASEGVDWNRFFVKAAHWQLGPAAMMNLSTLPGVPAVVSERARARSIELRATNLSRTLVTRKILALLGDQGVATLLLKGAATGVSAYGDPSLRWFSDVDILLHANDLKRAREILVAEGYVPGYELTDERSLIAGGHALEFSSGASKVELHSSLISHYLRVPFDMHDVWRQSVVVGIAGNDIRILDPATEFLFLCVHAAKHSWSELRSVFDIAQLLPQLSESIGESVVSLAQRLNAQKLLALGLEIVHDVLGISGHRSLDDVRRRFDTRPISQSVIPHFHFDDEDDGRPSAAVSIHSALPQLLFWVRTRERAIDRAATVAALLSGRVAKIRDIV